MKPTVNWIADRSGEAHAHVGRGRVIRAACGARAIDPRTAWPATGRCAACTVAVDALVGSAR